MAKRGVSATDATVVANAEGLDLKLKLRGLVNIILDDDNCPVATIHEAITTLSALKDLKYSRPLPQKFDELSIPAEFRCPISRELMRDPVILATGQVIIL